MIPFSLVFRTNAIILNTHTIRDGHTFVVLFSEEFGKISCWWKQRKSFPHDIGDIIETVIDRNNSINTVKYVEPRIAPCESCWTYKKVSLFLQSLSLLLTLLPEMSVHRSLFRDYEGFLQCMHDGYTLDEHHYLLFHLRILRTLGYIGSESFMESPILQYIFREVVQTPLGQLLRAKPLGAHEQHIIEQASHKAVYYSTL